MELPKKLTNQPIIEAVIEIRFDTVLPGEAVFGVLYSKLNELFPKLEKLPVLQIPENIRDTDPTLRFAALYSLRNEDYFFNIGNRVASLVVKNNYQGWDSFSKMAQNAFQKINETSAITKVNRFGLRYINFFNTPIFDHLNLKSEVPFNDEVFAKSITFHQKMDDVITKTVIADNAQLYQSGKLISGSIIDIDTIVEGEIDFFSDISKILNKSHDVEKRRFFSLLKKEFINELGATYD